MHVSYKPEEHNSMNRFKVRREKTARDVSASDNRKITLSKEMKASLLALGAFIEEQVDPVANAMNSNLQKGF